MGNRARRAFGRECKPRRISDESRSGTSRTALRVPVAAIGSGTSRIGATESGERRLDVVEFFEFAAALGVEPVALFERVARW